MQITPENVGERTAKYLESRGWFRNPNVSCYWTGKKVSSFWQHPNPALFHNYSPYRNYRFNEALALEAERVDKEITKIKTMLGE